MLAQLSYNGSTTFLSVRRVAPFYHFFSYTIPVDRLLQLVQLWHYVKQVNPPKFYLQHLVWGSYLSSLQNSTKCKTWLNSPGSPLLNISSWTLMSHNWQKWKSTFLACHCHEIYREEAAGLKSSSYTKKYDFCEYVKFAAISLKIDILKITP